MNFNPKCPICNNDIKCMYAHAYSCNHHYYIVNKYEILSYEDFSDKNFHWEMLIILNENYYLYINDIEEKYFSDFSEIKAYYVTSRINLLTSFMNNNLLVSGFNFIKLENINSITEAIEYIKALALFT